MKILESAQTCSVAHNSLCELIPYKTTNKRLTDRTYSKSCVTFVLSTSVQPSH